MHKFQIHIDSPRNIGIDEIHDALCVSYGAQKVNVYRVMEDGSLRASYREPPVGDPRPRQTKKILSEEWVEKLSEYWCDKDRVENLGDFIQRVAEATVTHGRSGRNLFLMRMGNYFSSLMVKLRLRKGVSEELNEQIDDSLLIVTDGDRVLREDCHREGFCKLDPEYTAILAVGEDGKAIVFKWINKENWMDEAIRSFNDLDEIEFNAVAGLYYADMTCSACGGHRCNGYPCAGDCWQSDWELKCLVDIKYLTMLLLGMDGKENMT